MFKINQPCVFEGYWAFSIDQSCWFSGVLKYTPDKNKIELRMWGPGKRAEIDFYTDTILGRTVDNKKITLINCIIRTSSSQLFKSPACDEIYLHIIDAAGILIGQHYNCINDIKYSSLHLQFANQIEFIQNNGFEHHYTQEKLTIRYQKPDDIVFLEDDTKRISINFFGFPVSTSYLPTYASITQKEYFILTFSTKQSLKILKEEIKFLQYFITFSINKNSCLYTCFFKESISSTYTKDISFLYHSFKKIKRKCVDNNNSQNLILLDDIKEYPDLYKKWGIICLEKKSAIYKFFTTIQNDNFFLDERFHRFIMAFEDYHRNSKEYPQKVEFINKKTHKKDIRDPYLRERLESVFKAFSKPLFYLFDKTPQEKERIIKLIKHTRDYLTHGGSVKKEKSVKDQDSYFSLIDLLITIISLMILKDLGFSNNTIAEKIWHLPEYQHLVSYDWSKIR